MKKLRKPIVLSITSLILIANITPPIVYASEIGQTINEQQASSKSYQDVATDEMNSRYMSRQEKENLITEVKRNHPTVSEKFIREALERQLAGDYSIPQEDEIIFYSAWQGVTVEQMGALIDVGLGALLGAGVGGLAATVAKVGKHQAKTKLKKVLIKYGLLGGFITDKVLDYALNLTSPGYHIAKYWDNHDKYPGNGRINFEW